MNVLKKYRQILLYGAIGIGALLFEVAAFYLLTSHVGIAVAVANAAAMLLGLVISFYLNAQYNFRVTDRKINRFIRFGFITFIGYWLSTAIIMLAIRYLQVPPIIAKAVSLPAFFLFQYTCNRLFTFNYSTLASTKEPAVVSNR